MNFNPLNPSLKRNSTICIDEKYNAILSIENKEFKVNELSRVLNVGRSTVNGWIQNKEKIKEEYESSLDPSKRIRIRGAKYPEIDKALMDWIRETRPFLNGPIIMDKAEEIGKMMNKEFKASSGWLERFKKRNGIYYDKFSKSTYLCNSEKCKYLSHNLLFKINLN